MGEIQLVPAELGGIVTESAMYGIFLVLFLAASYVLLNRSKASQGLVSFNRIMFGACLILFCSITFHWVLDVIRLFQAFVTYIDDPGPLVYYATLSSWENVTKTGLYIFQTFLGDCIIVYRLYIVWNRSTVVIIFPILTVLGLLICGTGITYEFSQLTFGENVFESVCGRWITSSFTFTLVTNLYSTFMISYKIWRTNKNLQRIGGSNLTPVIQIVIESAALYTACTFTTFVAYLAQSNFQFPGLDSTSPVIGITFCLIIVRVGLGFGAQGSSNGRMPTPLFTASHHRDTLIHQTSDGQVHNFQMRPLAVNITRQVQSAVDDDYIVKDNKDLTISPSVV